MHPAILSRNNHLWAMVLFVACGLMAKAQVVGRSPWAGVYIGAFGAPTFTRFETLGIFVREDGTGVFIPGPGNQGEPAFGGRRQFMEVFVGDDGRFQLGAPDTAYSIRGQFDSSGRVSGTAEFTSALNRWSQSFSAMRSPSTGAAARFAGYYRSPSGDPNFIIAADGKVFLQFGTENRAGYGGQGTVDAEGNLRAFASFRLTFEGHIAADASVITGSYGSFGINIHPFTSVNENVADPRRLVNLSMRARSMPGDAPLIVGLVITGSQSADILLRAVGPGLSSFGVTDAAPSAPLDVNRNGVPMATNLGWSNAPNPSTISAGATMAGAFPLAAGSADSALRAALSPAAYTMVIDANGVALGEIYELPSAQTPPALINFSARVVVRPGDDATVGFVINAEMPKKILLRAIGPSLAAFGVSQFLPRPSLTLFNGNQPAVRGLRPSEAATTAVAAARAGAFPLSPKADDAVLLVDLVGGTYTAHVTSGDGASGVVVIEVYAVP